jgi:hypothetical protein
MARLIVKSPYIKGGGKSGGGGGAGGYARYIGTRDGVEQLPSGYMGWPNVPAPTVFSATRTI